jgi:hypothetical protein
LFSISLRFDFGGIVLSTLFAGSVLSANIRALFIAGSIIGKSASDSLASSSSAFTSESSSSSDSIFYSIYLFSNDAFETYYSAD